ncbi:MAG: thioredoxin family protein [Desulfuromonadaceae bacterium]|nr:thioredoxin family protein [Desulfuromonadaceae bacterium]MDD5104400.1 thioredoxin family protein [Desulfuromonadaceae bacterium]
MKWVCTFLAVLLTASAACAELPSSNDAAIRAALASGKPTVSDFGARSCIPCKKMAPILEELSHELKGKANVTFSDVWKDNTVGGQYRVQMIPTQIFFNAQGKEVKRHIGFIDKNDILKELKAAGMK